MRAPLFCLLLSLQSVAGFMHSPVIRQAASQAIKGLSTTTRSFASQVSTHKRAKKTYTHISTNKRNAAMLVLYVCIMHVYITCTTQTKNSIFSKKYPFLTYTHPPTITGLPPHQTPHPRHENHLPQPTPQGRFPPGRARALCLGWWCRSCRRWW